jgi:glycogen debranching enzyme
LPKSNLNLKCLDSAVYTIEALEALHEMAVIFGDGAVADRCRDLAGAVRARLDEAFWMEAEGLYGDIAATPEEMIPRLQRWIEKARQPEVAEAYKSLLVEAQSDPNPQCMRPWQCRNWTIICPVEAGLAAPERAARILNRIESEEFTARWGMYLSGIERSRIMSINTGALAVAEAVYGRVERALDYMRRIAETLPLHMPGAISEMSPDDGCFVQAWSGYGIAWPIVAHFFGVRPDAFRRRLELCPIFPPDWHSANLLSLRVGSNRFDLRWDKATLTVASQEEGWTVTGSGVGLHVSGE